MSLLTKNISASYGLLHTHMLLCCLLKPFKKIDNSNSIESLAVYILERNKLKDGLSISCKITLIEP